MEDLVLLLVLLVVTFITGSYIEKKHYKSIREREASLPKIPFISIKRGAFNGNISRTELVSANVVIGADFFKTYLAGIINIFGGNISVLESVLERGRREAVLRLREQAKDASFIANMRYETSTISSGASEAPKVEVYVYATAIYS